MFDLELMNFNPEAPTFLKMLITALFAFFLSSIIAVTYELTTKSIYRRAHFLQSLALIGIVTATILQAIGESVAIGLGIIGALSIIRFRTSLNNPRNMTFMFASLGSGIACGVMGFGIAMTGTFVFCFGAIVLRFSPLADANELIGILKLQVPNEEGIQKEIEQKLKKHCRDFELNELRFINPTISRRAKKKKANSKKQNGKKQFQEFNYLIRLKKSTTVTAFGQNMREIEKLQNLQLEFQKQPTKL